MKKLMILVAVLSVSAALQAVPAEFSYQGVLRDTNDAPMTGNQTVQLRLYDVPTGGTELWGRTYSVLLDANGLFNIEVSDTTGTKIDSASTATLDPIFARPNATVYIGLTVVGSSGEIKPRQKLLPVPFSAVAGNVSRASGNFTVAGRLTAQSAEFTGNLTATNVSVTESVVATSLHVDGDAIVGGDLRVTGTISGFGTVPIGGIIMWSGEATKLPSGWFLCNGSNGTPDLRNRFVVGAGTGSSSYPVGKTGGAEKVTLKKDEIPSHSHMFSSAGASFAGALRTDRNWFYYTGATSYTNTLTTATAGSGQAHENLPPYYALCFIMRKE